MKLMVVASVKGKFRRMINKIKIIIHLRMNI